MDKNTQIIDTLREFLEKNELSKYDKVYLTGSNSSYDVQMISEIVNKNNKDAS